MVERKCLKSPYLWAFFVVLVYLKWYNLCITINRRFIGNKVVEGRKNWKMEVKIKDFAATRNVDRDTVNAFIRKHPEIRKDVKRVGKNTIIDDNTEGYELLNEKYPLPQLIQVIEDTESIKKLAAANERIAKLQEIVGQQKELLLKADNHIQLLEYKKDEFEHYKRESKEQIANLSTDLTEKNSEIERLKAELEVEKTRKLSLKERLFGKKW